MSEIRGNIARKYLVSHNIINICVCVCVCVCKAIGSIIQLFYILAHLFSQGHCDIIYTSFTIFSVEKIKVLMDAGHVWM